jgi:DNA-binding transcriptional regulator YdaS (Cro superfamily)
MSKLSEAIKAVGLTTVADRIGASPQAVSNWVARGRVPVEKCATVVAALEGRVSKADLRPDDWQAIWPETLPAILKRRPARVATGD